MKEYSFVYGTNVLTQLDGKNVGVGACPFVEQRLFPDNQGERERRDTHCLE